MRRPGRAGASGEEARGRKPEIAGEALDALDDALVRTKRGHRTRSADPERFYALIRRGHRIRASIAFGRMEPMREVILFDAVTGRMPCQSRLMECTRNALTVLGP